MAIALPLACLTTFALAADSQDMFFGGNVTHPSARPWVTDEGPGRSDMFQTPPQPVPDDMYGHTPHTNNSNGQDMLSGHVDHVPNEGLFQTPQNGSYR